MSSTPRPLSNKRSQLGMMGQQSQDVDAFLLDTIMRKKFVAAAALVQIDGDDVLR